MNQDRALCCEETEVHEDAVEQVRSCLLYTSDAADEL